MPDWQVQPHTTPSGKTLYKCARCGQEQPTPDKGCRGCCTMGWEPHTYGASPLTGDIQCKWCGEPDPSDLRVRALNGDKEAGQKLADHWIKQGREQGNLACIEIVDSYRNPVNVTEALVMVSTDDPDYIAGVLDKAGNVVRVVTHRLDGRPCLTRPALKVDVHMNGQRMLVHSDPPRRQGFGAELIMTEEQFNDLKRQGIIPEKDEFEMMRDRAGYKLDPQDGTARRASPNNPFGISSGVHPVRKGPYQRTVRVDNVEQFKQLQKDGFPRPLDYTQLLRQGNMPPRCERHRHEWYMMKDHKGGPKCVCKRCGLEDPNETERMRQARIMGQLKALAGGVQAKVKTNEKVYLMEAEDQQGRTVFWESPVAPDMGASLYPGTVLNIRVKGVLDIESE